MTTWKNPLPEEAAFNKKIKQSDKAAFETVIDENINKIRGLALSLTRNPHNADDLAQEVFLKAYKNISAFRNECKIGTWLYRITINTYLNLKKQEDRFHAKNYQKENGANRHFNNHRMSNNAQDSIKERIENALRLLTPKERAVFVLRHYEEINIEEIAIMLAISKNSVKTLLRRAVFKLKDFNVSKNQSSSTRDKK